jgi:hypothetical protein
MRGVTVPITLGVLALTAAPALAEAPKAAVAATGSAAAVATSSGNAAQTQAAPVASILCQPPSVIVNTTPATPCAESSTPSWAAALITSSAGLLGAYLVGHFAARNAKAAIVQRTNEQEIATIDKRLSEFFGPFMQLSGESQKLSDELKRRHDNGSYRLLLQLLQPGWKDGLPKGDRKLVDVIVQNGKRLRKLILDNAGAVAPALEPYLVATSTHFHMLYLAHSGSLDDKPERYKDYVYPRQLDRVLVLERNRQEARRELLRSKPDVAHPTIAGLVIPEDLKLAPTDIKKTVDAGATAEEHPST